MSLFKSKRHLCYFILFAIIFNIPALFYAIPGDLTGLKLILFLPMLFWISIPGVPLSITPLFKLSQFGAEPGGPLSYFAVFTFWILIAYVLTLTVSLITNKINSYFSRK